MEDVVDITGVAKKDDGVVCKLVAETRFELIKVATADSDDDDDGDDDDDDDDDNDDDPVCVLWVKSK